MTTRRSFIVAGLLGAALASSPAALSQATAQAITVGAIRVDVSRLQQQGWGEQALAIKLGLERELTQALGPKLRRGAGPTLVVTVRGVFLNSYVGGGGSRWGGGGDAGSDSFDSEAKIIDRANRVLATYPVLSTLPPSNGGAWYLPDIDQRRLAGLIQNNAAWITRYVGG